MSAAANEKNLFLAVFLLYRRFLKSIKIVYNRIGIKNIIAKEEKEGFTESITKKYIIKVFYGSLGI